MSVRCMRLFSDGFLSGRFPANGVAESHLLVVFAARVMREERGLQRGLEGCSVVAQDPLRSKGGGIQVAYDHVDGPGMRYDKGVAGHR